MYIGDQSLVVRVVRQNIDGHRAVLDRGCCLALAGCHASAKQQAIVGKRSGAARTIPANRPGGKQMGCDAEPKLPQDQRSLALRANTEGILGALPPLQPATAFCRASSLLVPWLDGKQA